MGKTKIVTRSRAKRNKNNVEENAVENSPKRISISVQDQTEQVNIATEAMEKQRLSPHASKLPEIVDGGPKPSLGALISREADPAPPPLVVQVSYRLVNKR